MILPFPNDAGIEKTHGKFTQILLSGLSYNIKSLLHPWTSHFIMWTSIFLCKMKDWNNLYQIVSGVPSSSEVLWFYNCILTLEVYVLLPYPTFQRHCFPRQKSNSPERTHCSWMLNLRSQQIYSEHTALLKSGKPVLQNKLLVGYDFGSTILVPKRKKGKKSSE